MPTVPTPTPSWTIGRVRPGRTPISSRAWAALWVLDRWVLMTSIEASWKLPTRDLSPLPITTPSASVMITFRPMMALVSPAISWASAGLRAVEAPVVREASMDESY